MKENHFDSTGGDTTCSPICTIICALLAAIAILFSVFMTKSSVAAPRSPAPEIDHTDSATDRAKTTKDHSALLAGYVGPTKYYLIRANDKTSEPQPPANANAPVDWQASFLGGQLSLAGTVTNEADRDALATAAKDIFKSAAIVDKTAIDDTRETTFVPAARLILRQLSYLEEGSAALRGRHFVVKGIARHQSTAESVRTALSDGFTSNDYSIEHEILYREATIPTANPFVTTITNDGKHLNFSGYTPGKSTTDKIFTASQRLRKDLIIVDEMSIAKGAPDGWQSCVMAGLEGLLQLENGRVELSNRDLLLTGLTRNEDIGEKLPAQVRAAANRACTDRVRLRVETPPEPDLNWSAVLTDGTLTLSGEVPNSAIQTELEKTAKRLLPKREHKFDLRVSPATTKKWQSVALTGLSLLSTLRTGTVTLNGQRLFLSGEATDTTAVTAIQEQLKAAIPKGYTAQSAVNVKSAAMLWAEREAKRSREEAEAEARSKAEAAKADQLKADAERQAARDAREAAERAETERRIAAQRDVYEPPDSEAEQRRILRDQHAATARQRACQTAIDNAMREGTITFAPGSDRIEKGSLPTLDRLARLTGVCKDTQIEIAGHTDSVGTFERNLDLSERRARAVLRYLVEAGVPAQRLTARGYGESTPIVPNDTYRNRVRNRRIEFRVRVN
ncbi:MAG: OmpA family protein [Hyphomicrobiaceae bacterium]